MTLILQVKAAGQQEFRGCARSGACLAKGLECRPRGTHTHPCPDMSFATALKSRKWRWALATLLVGGVLAGLFGGRLLDHALTKSEVYKFHAVQAEGGTLPTSVVERAHGFFISGGHGWSIGDLRYEYVVTFMHEAHMLRWEGPGVPLILQRQGGSFYLATFDRETTPMQADFRCYLWAEGAWKELPTKLFPRRLALVNLIDLGGSSALSVQDPMFRYSLMAKLWFCIESGLPEREVSDSMVTEEFVRRFGPTVKEAFAW